MINPEKEKQLRQKAMRLPLSPGVYIMKNKAGEIIYIGKAKALKNRVSQYFGSHTNHAPKVIKMVENVENFDYILVNSEFEALVLEANLIKKHTPKYNILLKDDKGYSYIKITNEKYRRISAVLQKDDDDATYIGPYMSYFYIKQAVEDANTIYRLSTCNRTLPGKLKTQRPCLNYSIKKCSAPCCGKIRFDEYNQNVEEAIGFLTGDRDRIAKDLEKRMFEAAENEEFELAAKLRDRLTALKKIGEKQHVVSQKIEQQDVFAIASMLGKACLNVLRFSGGRVSDNEFFFLDEPEDMPKARADMIMSFYGMRDDIPPRVSLDGEVTDRELLERFLSEKAGRRVHIAVPERGEQTELVALSFKNACEKLMQKRGRTSAESVACDEIAKLLGLEKAPEYIESYDISNTAGADNVAGMVVFKDGKPFKKAYRTFKIKGFEGQDDYASMAELVRRRIGEYEKHRDDGNTFGIKPDLILLDGGIGQVNAVLPVLQELSFDVPVFGMVKDSKHRTRAIAAGGGEISIDSVRTAFTLVSGIQEEVHRFAITYHRKTRSKSGFSSSLTQIPGIGEKKAKMLLKDFKSIKNIKTASVQELSMRSYLSTKNVQNIVEFFNKQ